MYDTIAQFKAAMSERAIIPPSDVIADGKIHRCDAEGRGGRNDASYLLHLDDSPAGGFENHRDGLSWQNWRPASNGSKNLTKAELETRQAAAKAKTAEREKLRKAAQENANLILAEARICTEHPYLDRKGIGPHGAKLHNDRLVIPLRDTLGATHSLQFIHADGSKLFHKDGPKKGLFYQIGTPQDVVCICEGFATGASIHEATGYAVAVAFDAGNLRPVAEAIQTKYPDANLLICGDDDYRTEANPGITKATEAAQAVGALLAIPKFGDNRPDSATDFNDLHQAQGLDAVKACLLTALGKKKQTKTKQEYGGGYFESTAKGIFYVGANKEGDMTPPRWLCAPLHVKAQTRDAKSGEWGRLLEWSDADGVTHTWAMPLEQLQGDGLEVRRTLARQGLNIAPNRTARDLLGSYLQVCEVQARARCVDRLGWHGDNYILPSGCIGHNDELVVFQNTHALEPQLSTAGTAAEWRAAVAKLATGNSRLVFAISTAFAGPLAELAGEDSGGFHLRGKSSSGKTTALKLAASVWGNPTQYPRLWRTTANGLEGLAALHNDGLLILDELSQVDPREAGEAAYLLANGQGKTRATRTGTAKQSARWRLLFLSAGEESLTALMAKAGKKANAGQEIRLADIDADAGAGLGAFEYLHEHQNPAAMALALKDAANRSYGAVGMAWLQYLVENRPRLAELVADGLRQFVTENAPPEASGQITRVARRFGLVAVAGELATHCGLTGWSEGEAANASAKCFEAWLDSFGRSGSREDKAILEKVRLFIEQHGASRFEDVAATEDKRIPNRAGFLKVGADGSREYWLLPEVFKAELCSGFDSKTVVGALLTAGWLQKGGDGRHQQKPRIAAMGGTARVYVLLASKMFEDTPCD